MNSLRLFSCKGNNSLSFSSSTDFFKFSETLSVYGDVSYVLALSQKDKYNPAIDGFSFNGNLLTATIGVSVSLSGCRYCD